jgi:hypothetical protein
MYQYWIIEEFRQILYKIKGKWDNQRNKIGQRVEEENEGLFK